MRTGLLLVALLSVTGCTRASLLVCREVTEAGVCRGPSTDLVVGHEYAVLATGFGLPRGSVELRLFERVAGVERRIATARPRIPDGAARLVAPLTLPRVGDYRLELVDGDGDRYRSIRLRAPRPTFNVVASPTAPSRLPVLRAPTAATPRQSP